MHRASIQHGDSTDQRGNIKDLFVIGF